MIPSGEHDTRDTPPAPGEENAPGPKPRRSRRERQQADDDDHDGEDAPPKPTRGFELARDARLMVRVLGYLGRYPFLSVVTMIMMVGEALTSVAGIGMLKPVLDIVFEKKVDTFAKYADEFPIVIAPGEGDPGNLAVSGYLFLPQHEKQLVAALDAAGPGAKADLGGLLFFGDESLEHLPADRLIAIPADHGDFLADPPAGQPPLTWKQSFRVHLMSRFGHELEALAERIKSDPPFAFRLLIWAMAFFIGITVLKVIFAFGAEVLARRIGFGVVEDLRRETYGHLLRLDFGYFGKRPVGDLINLVTGEIGQLQQVIQMVFTRFLQTPIRFIITILAMLYISPTMTLLCMVSLGPLMAVLLYVSRKVRKTARRAQEHRAALTIVLQETFSGIRTVKAYGMEAHEGRRFGERSHRLLRQQLKGSILSESASQLNELIMTFLVVAIVLLGGWFVLIGAGEQRIAPSLYIVFLGLLVEVFRPLRQWSKALVRIQAGLNGAERVFEVLDTPSTIVDAPDAIDCDGRDTHIALRNVSFAYEPGRPILRNIDLTLEQGQVLALVGPAGCGKSTLVHLLPRFYEATSGEVRIGGNDVRRYKLASLRDKIGIVSQHVTIFDDTVRGNIAYGRLGTPLEQIVDAAKSANIHDEIMALPKGYDTQVGGDGMRLSGGQRQRVAIARALLKNPPILILDEATSSLDVQNERLIQESLERLMKGRTVIVIAHRLSTVRNADLICAMRDGEIVERGTHDELLALGGLYAKYHGISMSRRDGDTTAPEEGDLP